MEQPYKGRAILQDHFSDFEITIPARRNWFLILFIGVWLGGWLFGEVTAITTVTGILSGHPANLFMFIWLGAWTVGGFFALRTFLWNVMGKEKITIGQGTLSIDKKAALLFKPKTYDLDEVKNIRVQENNVSNEGLFRLRRKNYNVYDTNGAIWFDYGLQTVKFAEGIDEAEARFIIEKLKKRRFLTNKNFI